MENMVNSNQKLMKSKYVKKVSISELLWSRPIMKLARGAKKASYLELFFDLSICAAVGTAAHQIGGFYTIGPIGWIYWLMGFYSIFSLWVSITTHLNKFTTTGIKYRLIILFTMVPVALLSAGIVQTSTWFLSETDFRISPIFLMGFVLSRAIITGLFFEVWIWNRKKSHRGDAVRLFLIPGLIYLCITIAASMLLIFTGDNYTSNKIVPIQIVMGISMASELIVDTYKLSATSRISSLNKEHLHERFALLLIISLGEAMVSASWSISNDITLRIPFHQNLWLIIAQSSFRIISCFFLLFLIWWAYIDKMPHFDFSGKGRWRIIAFVYLNFVIIIGIMLISYSFFSRSVSTDSIISQNKWSIEQKEALKIISDYEKQGIRNTLNAMGDKWKVFRATNKDISAIGQIGFGLTFLGISLLQLASKIPHSFKETSFKTKVWFASVTTLALNGIYGISMGIAIQNVDSLSNSGLNNYFILINIATALVAVGFGIIIWFIEIIALQKERTEYDEKA